MADPSITAEEYEAFCAFLRDACGIMLGDNKHYLVSSRLAPLLSEHQIDSIGAMLEQLKRNRNSALMHQVIDAMTTNETSWFRDSFLFDALTKSLITEFAQRGPLPIRIWSAACSSGQEPYTISMAAQEFLDKNPGKFSGDIQILATDISPSMLKQAESATYDSATLARGLSGERQQKFFVKKGVYHELRPDIRRRVSFREFNLTQSYQPLGKFDMIFCRNVLIYFSAELKRDILARLAEALNPNGYLFLGAAESMANYSESFDMVRIPGGLVYRLKPQRARTRHF